MDTFDLADACQSLAEDLHAQQRALNFTGPQAIELGKLSVNLSALASTLRTIAVADAIGNSEAAVQGVKSATQAAKDAAGNLNEAAAAIKVAGLVLSLGAAVISEDPGTVISSAKDLVDAVSGV